MGETRKSHKRRAENGDFKHFFKGQGIDIGCGSDPVTPDCDQYDLSLGSGDAQVMSNIMDERYDWVYSSHCLEHIERPEEALKQWWRIVKPLGHMIIVVPDFGMYEHFRFPSRFNSDHKHGYSIGKSEAPHRKDIIAMVLSLENAHLLRAQINDEHYVYSNLERDQAGQREIEVILRKQDPYWCR